MTYVAQNSANFNYRWAAALPSRLFAAALAVAASAAVLETVPAANAAPTTFTSLASFQAATSGLTTVDFNGTAGGSTTDHAQNFSTGGVNFSVPNPNIIYSAAAGLGFPSGTAYGSDYLEWQDSSKLLTISLPKSVRALAFNYAELRLNTDTFTISDGTDTFTENTSTSGISFFGFIADTPFSSITIHDTGDINPTTIYGNFATIDNLRFGDSLDVSVPEPATQALLGGSLLGLGYLRRRSKVS